MLGDEWPNAMRGTHSNLQPEVFGQRVEPKVQHHDPQPGRVAVSGTVARLKPVCPVGIWP